METISNEEFIGLVIKDSGAVVGKAVQGNVIMQGLDLRSADWSGCHFLGQLAIRNCSINAPLLLDNCTIDTDLEIEHCEVAGWVSGEGLTVRRNLFLVDAKIQKGAPPRVQRGGNSIEREELFTGLSLRGAAIGGDLRLEQVRVGDEVTWLAAQGIEVGGDVLVADIGGIDLLGETAWAVYPSLRLDHCRIAGRMLIERCRLGQVKLNEANLSVLTIRESWISLTLSLVNSRVGKAIFSDSTLDTSHFEQLSEFITDPGHELDAAAMLRLRLVALKSMEKNVGRSIEVQQNKMPRHLFSETDSPVSDHSKLARLMLSAAMSSRRLRQGAGFMFLVKAINTICHPNGAPRGMSYVFHVDISGAEIDFLDLRGVIFYCDVPRTAPITGEKCHIHRELIAAEYSFLGADKSVPVMELSFSVIHRISLNEEIPRPLALNGTRIEHWGYLGFESEPSEFIQAIENVSGDDITLFRSIEAGYAANGNHEAANSIYRHWRRKSRIRSNQSSRRRGLFLHLMNWPARAMSSVHDYLFGFGTRLGFSVFVLMALFAVSWFSIATHWSSLVALPASYLADVSDAGGEPVTGRNLVNVCVDRRADMVVVENAAAEAERGKVWAAKALCIASMHDESRATRIAYSAVIALQFHAPMLGLEPLPSVSYEGKILGIFPTRIWFEFMKILNWLGIPVIVAVGIGRLIPRRYA